MCAKNFFQLGCLVGRLEHILNENLEEITNDNILWGTPIDSEKRHKLVEARRILYCIKYSIEYGQIESYDEMIKKYENAFNIVHNLI
jgi:hypothetical protein